MYLHIGNEIVIPCQEIIAILNLATAGNSDTAAREEAKEETGTENLKSCIITAGKVYYSTISSGTLMKRAQAILNNPEQE